MSEAALDQAEAVLERAVMTYHGKPVGLEAAASDNQPSAPNYRECFVRDYAVAGFYYLATGRAEFVRNFLELVLELRETEPPMQGFEVRPGVLPASFRVSRDGHDGGQKLVADFGNRAIGRVAPVDSVMWWLLLLRAYTMETGDTSLIEREDCRETLGDLLGICLQGSFEIFPTLLVPDGCFMIDRRMGVHGHPLEIQALFYAMLGAVGDCFGRGLKDPAQAQHAADRRRMLRDYVRRYYWLDIERITQIHRQPQEAFGADIKNFLNIHPESIPEWIESWLPKRGGYLAGNLGSERLDTRFFGQGNLLSVIFGLTDDGQTGQLMNLYAERWDDLVGAVPARICFPAMEGEEWRLLTGCDTKNAPWSYHNGGCWPVLLWDFVAAALRAERRELADRAWQQALERVPGDQWAEYYDGRAGTMIGADANLNQVWSAAGLLLARKLLDDPSLLRFFPATTDDENEESRKNPVEPRQKDEMSATPRHGDDAKKA